MSTNTRILLLIGAFVAAVAAFFVLKPAEDLDTPPRQGAGTDTATTRVPPEGEPALVTIRVRGGKPVGGAKSISVDTGETVRLDVDSDVTDWVHVHGYDLAKRVGPGLSAPFHFKADKEGVFKIELEERGLDIARLEVKP